MIAVIAGATGLVGSKLIKKLLEDGTVEKVVSVSRRPVGIVNPKLHEVVIDDLSELLNVKEQLRGDTYFCCLGTTIKSAKSKENFRKVDYTGIVDFAKVAEHFSATSFVVISSMGADAKSPFFYNQVKGETEEAIKLLILRSLIIFRPGLLVGDRKEVRLAEAFAVKMFAGVARMLPKSVSQRIATNVEMLAASMLQAAKTPKPGVTIKNAPEI